MNAIIEKLTTLISDSRIVLVISAVYIAMYYFVSFLFIQAARKSLRKGKKAPKLLAKNGFFDWLTSGLWMVVAIILIWSLVKLSMIDFSLSLEYLIIYYFLFIFIFSILYGLLEWHFEGMLAGIANRVSWDAEIRYLIMSIQTQTTLGYTSTKPGNTITELISCLQALLGLFFIAISIALAITNFSN